MSKKHGDSLEKANAKILAELAVDSQTSVELQVKIIAKLLEDSNHESFFRTLFSEALSYGQCPSCNHFNHWAVPETNLNEFGEVTHHRDKKVLKNTTSADCARFAEACKKKKINI